jgi:hypothetical protein
MAQVCPKLWLKALRRKNENACVPCSQLRSAVGDLLERIGSKEKPVQYLEMLERFFVGTRNMDTGTNNF